MQDFEVFGEALANDSSYNSNLARSLSLTLDEFYKDLSAVGVSATTGQGLDQFMEALDRAVIEYKT